MPTRAFLSCGLLAALWSTLAISQDKGTSPATKGNESGLDLTNFPGMVLEDVVVPVPSELLSVLDKLGDPDWKQELVLGPKPEFTDRREVALLLGATVADGFIAVQAQDLPSVERIGKEVLQLSRSLGVKDAVNEHCNRIATAAKKNDWPAVREALDATQATVRERMARMKDETLAECISIGGWLRGTQVLTNVIAKSYTQTRAELLHQPDLAEYFRDTLQELEAKGNTPEKITLLSSGLGQIYEIMAKPETSLDREAVGTIQRISADLVNRIQTKG
jgi:hypothetical protein